jgi:hypothetical protein
MERKFDLKVESQVYVGMLMLRFPEFKPRFKNFGFTRYAYL